MSNILANWNGHILPLEDVRVPALDRAFLFGDSVYEVIRIYGARPWRLTEHIERLANGLTALKIPFSAQVAEERLLETLKASSQTEALAYIQVTRGAAARHHYYPEKARPNCLLWIEPFGDPFKNERTIGAKAITYPDIRWKRNDLKSTSLAANCLAAQAAHEVGCMEAILIDDSNHMAEGSHSSIFIVSAGKIVITPSSSAVLPGITKRQLIELSRQTQVELKEARITKAELLSADEIFLTATPEEIIGIVEVDGLCIADGKPGPITQRLQLAFTKSVKTWLST